MHQPYEGLCRQIDCWTWLHALPYCYYLSPAFLDLLVAVQQSYQSLCLDY